MSDETVRIRIAGIEMCGRCRRKMAACGESHDSDLIGVQVPRLRMGPHHADGSLRVIQHGGMMVTRRQPVLQYEGGKSVRCEPFSRIRSFVTGEEAVSTARAH